MVVNQPLTSLYTLSNCNGTTTTPSTGAPELSTLGLAAIPAASKYLILYCCCVETNLIKLVCIWVKNCMLNYLTFADYTNPLNLTSLGSLAALTPAGLQAYQGRFFLKFTGVCYRIFDWYPLCNPGFFLTIVTFKKGDQAAPLGLVNPIEDSNPLGSSSTSGGK